MAAPTGTDTTRRRISPSYGEKKTPVVGLRPTSQTAGFFKKEPSPTALSLFVLFFILVLNFLKNKYIILKYKNYTNGHIFSRSINRAQLHLISPHLNFLSSSSLKLKTSNVYSQLHQLHYQLHSTFHESIRASNIHFPNSKRNA